MPSTVVPVKRVPETMLQQSLAAIHSKTAQTAPLAQLEDLADYDAIIFGKPTLREHVRADANFS